MANTAGDIARLRRELADCRGLLAALGDETRQQLLLAMLSGPCGGCRAVDLAAQASLSRPAVSRHLNVLRQAGLVRTRREGARVYHYLAPDPALLRQLTGLVLDVQRIAAGAPDRSAPQAPAAPPPPRADAVQ